MKNFYILGQSSDCHADYVSWALRAAGFQTIWIDAQHEACPTNATMYLDGGAADFRSIAWDDAEATWYRRLPPAPVSRDNDDQDEHFCLIQRDLFASWVVELQQNLPGRWINRPNAVERAENKLLQLNMAKAHGLRVPRTLITKDPSRFRSFLRAEGTVVGKPLLVHSWEEKSGGALAAFATIIDARVGSELSDDDIVQCETIYQERIEKESDIRVIVMGKDVFAFKVVQLGEQHFDFRVAFHQKDHIRFEPVPIPDAFERKLLRFMATMKLEFASTDFARTADGELIFLDLNPVGQWLFIEHFSPHIKIGQKFCSFFVRGAVDPEFQDAFPSFSEYLEAYSRSREPLGYSAVLRR